MKKIEDFDAVIFHHFFHYNLSDLPVRRKSRQFYIYANIEGPVMTDKLLPDYHSLSNYFNLSMTYRLDADIVQQYGRFVRLSQPPNSSHGLKKIMRNFGAANTQLARKEKGQSDKEVFSTWFVTKCSTPGKRKDIANSTSNLIFYQCQ